MPNSASMKEPAKVVISRLNCNRVAVAWTVGEGSVGREGEKSEEVPPARQAVKLVSQLVT